MADARLEGEHQQEKRNAETKRAFEKNIEFAEFFYNTAGRRALLAQNLKSLTTGKGINFKDAQNLFLPGPHDTLSASAGGFHFLKDDVYEYRGYVYSLETIKDASGVETGIACVSNHIPVDSKDAEKLYGDQMDLIILGKGARVINFNIREDANLYQVVMELEAVMNEAAKRKVLVNFGPNTLKKIGEIANQASIPGNSLPGGLKWDIRKIIGDADPLTYFRDRQEELKVIRNLDEKYTEDFDKRVQKKLKEIPRKTEEAGYTGLRTNADKTAYLKASVAAAANLGAVNQDAKLNVINTQVTDIMTRIEALNTIYKGVAERIGTYNKVLDEEKAEPWEIKKMFRENPAGEEHTQELIDEIEKERNELTAQLNAWKEILNTAPYNNAAAAETINAKLTALEAAETASKLPGAAAGSFTAADATTLKILKDITKAVNSGDTALNNTKVDDLNNAFDNLKTKTETLVQAQQQRP